MRRYEPLADPAAFGRALVRLSRHHYMTGETNAAEDAVSRAVRVLDRSAAPRWDPGSPGHRRIRVAADADDALGSVVADRSA
ncbi:hypothetical protein OG948_54780 (plasmid) [Embleya sp. NBC_00888]|uniref:hypothetical protein n=1 Tax=Embleya sp. NBC_00888 TaxID=2975960 RepID=UPI002F918CCF|nr:hypothetical protein OG948_54780 [Embleya sp. NBC_00888]